MHKALRGGLLSLTLVYFFISCSEDQNPGPKFVPIENACYHANNNMLSLIDQRTRDPAILSGKTFAIAFFEAILARNESNANRNSVDVTLNKLFLRPQEMGGDSQKGYVKTLEEISEEINKQSTSRCVVMGNTKGSREDFSKLGLVFESKGLGYALLVRGNGTSKVFFSDNESKNKIFIDEVGQEYDSKGFKKWIKQINQFQCAVIPILTLNLKKDSTFVHLGGYFGKERYGLSMLLSLIGSLSFDRRDEIERLRRKKRPGKGAAQEKVKKCKIFLYAKSVDQKINCDDEGQDSTINMVEIFPYCQNKNLTFYNDWFTGISRTNIFEKTIGYEQMANQQYVVFSPQVIGGAMIPILKEDVAFKKVLTSIVASAKKWNIPESTGEQLKQDVLYQMCVLHQKNIEKRKNLKDENDGLSKEVTDLENILKSIPAADPKRTTISKDKEDKKSKITTNNKEIKNLKTFKIPQGEVLRVSYVIFSSSSNEVIEAEDEKGKKNFVLSCYSFNEGGKVKFTWDANKGELVEYQAN